MLVFFLVCKSLEINEYMEMVPIEGGWFYFG